MQRVGHGDHQSGFPTRIRRPFRHEGENHVAVTPFAHADRRSRSVAALAGAAGSAQAKIKKPLPAQKVSEKRRVLIQSSSHYHTSGYLDFAGEQYEQLYGSTKYEILFIPYAKVAHLRRV